MFDTHPYSDLPAALWDLVNESRGRIVAIWFYAEVCGPCVRPLGTPEFYRSAIR